MKVVVIGATGNVGTSVVRALGADPNVSEVVGLARRVPAWSAPKTTFAAVDVATAALGPHVRGADAVVHLAWLFQPTHRPLVTWRTNVLGTIRVLDAVAAAGVPRLVYASSIGAYSPAVGDRVVDESWPTDSLPTAAYGREKAYVERALDGFEGRHPEVRVVRFRPAFVFQRAAATEQRRLFLGPLLPGVLVRPGLLPVLPLPAGLRFQAVHADDLADAYRAAVLDEEARGAFNVAADGIIDGRVLADLLGSRAVSLPRGIVRAGLAAAWHLRLVPADPALLDLALGLPLIDPGRAHEVLGWTPRSSGADAVAEMLGGLRAGAGGPTPPLAGDSLAGRAAEVATGVGERP